MAELPRNSAPRKPEGSTDRTWSTLIVDDEVASRTLYRAFLQPAPEFRVVGEAGDGAAAIRESQRLQPELILLDLRMPGMDGFEALPQIRKAAPKARIIVLSVLPAEKEGAAAFWLGATGYIEKPNEPQGFLNDLRTLLRQAPPPPPPSPPPKKRLNLRKPRS